VDWPASFWPESPVATGIALDPIGRFRVAGHDRWRIFAAFAFPKRTAMILEICQIDVKPGTEAEFEAGVAKAKPLFLGSKGCHGLELRRSIEKPGRYRLLIQWETLENHTVDFRGSENFQEWRRLVSHCFENPPEVEHTTEIG
jgi:quinol monooxygenase YgiN